MKKALLYLFILSMGFFAQISLQTSSLYAQVSPSAIAGNDNGNVVINGNFDDGLTSWTPFIADFAGVSASVAVVDGEAAITNIAGTSDVVWHVQLNQLLTAEQISSLEVGGMYKIQFDARSSVEGRPLRSYFGEDGGGFVAINISDVNLTTSMETYEFVFEVPQTFGAMKLGFELGNSNDDVFIDNVSLRPTDEPVVAAPPMPAGLVVSNMIGEEPVSDGELFIAAGANNVEEENIEYRLFYSKTAQAPSNPLTAAEYTFGTTAGDGNGVAAFGFRLGNLEPGTNYTVWLYQYDTVNELFSEPAVGSAVSGGEPEPTDPVIENLIINGDFEDGLTNWAPFIADFAGVSASVAVVDGEAAITNIAGTSDVVWHVQLNQHFSAAQIQALEVGKNYKAKFDARSSANNRQLRFYFGEDGGGFAPLHIEDLTLSTDMETYEVVFQVTNTFGAMKFGFELGMSNDDVFIDNVSLMLTDELPQIPPPTPDGFLVSDMIGEVPVGDGEIFLSAGPNNTAEELLSYRLFYSVSASAPSDPTEATEYIFGTTLGDGDGIGPFGFVIGDLEHGTEYTFWLYQYNSGTGLFSDPAIGTGVTGGQAVSTPNELSNLPDSYDLAQNFPNPFNPTTQIAFALPETGMVKLEVFNVMGQLVATLANETMTAGHHAVTFDAASLASGIYLYRLQAGNMVLTRKMILVK